MRSAAQLALSFLLASLTPSAPRAQEPDAERAGVRLLRVPERLALPAERGANMLLEVEAPAAATEVWIGAEGTALRVPLVAVGDRRHQLNLADPRVARLARRADAAFVVHARLDGRTLTSAPVAFARAEMPAAELRCAIRCADRPAPVPIAAGTARWFDVASVTRIEIAAPVDDVVLLARAGSTDLPVPRARDGDAFALELDDALRALWREAGTLAILAQRGAEIALCCELRAVPTRLRPGGAAAPFVVGQRRSAPIPCTDDWLQVELDDITAGQVRLTVLGAGGRVLVPARSVRDGDVVPLPLADDDAVLEVVMLHNLPFGEDWADLRVATRAQLGDDRIEWLLRRIAGAAGCRFERNGRTYSGAAAAQHIRRKLAALAARPTLADFVDEVASRSSTTSTDYRVIDADGIAMSMRDWLRAELRERPSAADRDR
ncbi:MAG: DUF5329 family protein [Planctomycetota bacterium]